MKRFASIALVFVLTAALFTGCGCTNRNRPMDTVPTVLPTTQATTEPTHATTHATVPEHTAESTVDHGNGPLEDHAATTDTTPAESTTEGQARSAMPRTR